MNNHNSSNEIKSITFKVDDVKVHDRKYNHGNIKFTDLIKNNKSTTLKQYDNNNNNNKNMFSFIKSYNNNNNNSNDNNYLIHSSIQDKGISSLNSFIETAYVSYNYHYKLVIRPDDVWMSILKMFSVFINNNSELLRNKFVDFNGKQELIVSTEYRILEAPYDKLILKMKDAIQKSIIDPSITDWLVPSFTTTTETDKIVFSSALMSSLQAYFNYSFVSKCGLPEVTLLGSVDDWVDVKSRFNKVKEYDSGTNQMNQWCDLLNPVLDKFIETAQGNPDIDWWSRIAKNERRGSGGAILSGWITAFIIYDVDGQFILNTHRSSLFQKLLFKNNWLTINYDRIPCGYTSVPIKLKDLDGSQYDSELYSGHLTFIDNQNDNSVLQPSLDWYLIIDKNKL